VDLDISVATDAALAAELTGLVNRVYAEAERGLWADGATRTAEAEMRGLIAAGQIAVARHDGAIVGAVRVQRIDGRTGEFGMLVADPRFRGAGIGRALVRFAERWAGERGLRRMQLELLVPRGWTHPVKEFTGAWYRRMGYRVVRTGDFAADHPALVDRLATPCDYLIFQRELG
jgi:GNAT superfamily N-acetyltransferase